MFENEGESESEIEIKKFIIKLSYQLPVFSCVLEVKTKFNKFTNPRINEIVERIVTARSARRGSLFIVYYNLIL